MTFMNPNFFWIMIVPFIIIAFMILSSRERVSEIFSKEILERLRVDEATMPIFVRNVVMLIALFLMIVALARPVVEKGERVVAVRGVSAMASLDISGSMRSKDIYPNRLEFAKKKLIELLQAMPTDELSLTAFAHVSFMLAPFTSDKATLEQIVDGVNESYINMASTDFTALADLASKMLEKKSPKILIVVSDGGDKHALEGFAEILEQNKITLYVVLVGTEQGAPVLNAKGKTISTKEGSIAISQLNRDLGDIAIKTGGTFVVAGNGKADMQHLVSTIRDKFNDKKQGEVKIKERIEFFIYPLLLSVILLLIGFGSIPKKISNLLGRGRKKVFVKDTQGSASAGIDRWR